MTNGLCDVCNGVIKNVVNVVVGDDLFKVCCFDCKDVIVRGRSVDVGCGFIDGDKVRDVKMCNGCSFISMPFTCYAYKRDNGMTLMFVGYGRRKDDE